MAITIDGVSATDDPLANDLVVQMDREVGNEDVDNTQFTTMQMKLPASTAKSFKEEWLEDVYIPKHTALAASATSADTTFTITTNEGSYAKVGDWVLLVQSGERFRLTGVSASAWTAAARGMGTVSAASAASGTSLGGIMIINGSQEQGSTAPTAQVTEKTTNYNYAQIITNNYEYTSTAEWTEWYSGDPIAYQRKKVAVEHKREIEQGLFFGNRAYSAGTTHPRGTFGGLDQFISTNITDIAGAMDKGELNDFLRSGLEYGERTRKVLFAAPIVAQVISEFLADNWVRTTPSDSVWGVRADAIIDAVHGARIPVFIKNDWKRYGEGTANQIGSRAYLVDMTKVQIKRAPATRRGSRFCTLYSKQQANDKDSLSETYLSELTFVLKNEKAHALLRGVSG